jgi:hypothetical protein
MVEAAPGAQIRLLNEILRILVRPKHPIAMKLNLPTIGISKSLEGVLITHHCEVQRIRLVRQSGRFAH